jgi:hypothetical protein
MPEIYWVIVATDLLLRKIMLSEVGFPAAKPSHERMG